MGKSGSEALPTSSTFPGPLDDNQLGHLNLVGASLAFREAVRLIQRIAACDVTTLIEGETGTGKEVAARAIHYLGNRRSFPFIPLNCGALPDSLLESELYGHEKGAFTDAHERRAGLVTEADSGTLFLDEVEAMSPRAQVVLLRFLQDQKYRPIGGREMRTANLRVVAASNANLAALADRNEFRRDLLFRLAVLQVSLPPLRLRAGDVPLLASAFLSHLCATHGTGPRRFSTGALRRMEEHDWPGNVRELQNFVTREFFLGEGAVIEVQAPGVGPLVPGSAAGGDLFDDRSFKQAKAEAVARFERSWLERLLARAEGNISVAARLARKDRSALNKLVCKHGLAYTAFRPAARSRPPIAPRG